MVTASLPGASLDLPEGWQDDIAGKIPCVALFCAVAPLVCELFHLFAFSTEPKPKEEESNPPVLAPARLLRVPTISDKSDGIENMIPQLDHK